MTKAFLRGGDLATDTGTEGRQCESAQEEWQVKTGLEQCVYKVKALVALSGRTQLPVQGPKGLRI